MTIDAYLRRINTKGSLSANLDTLRSLHKAHLLSVPFENLDIILGRPISLETSVVFAKVVENRRGGFCYELNSLFGWLLRELGFKVTLLAASVFNADDEPGPEYDHLMLLVDLGDQWIADVGFGDSSLYPLKLDDDQPQFDGRREFRVDRADGKYCVVRRTDESEWKRDVIFTLQPRVLDEFLATCQYHQSSPESPFTRRIVCSLATPSGRITLRGQLDDMKVIITDHGQKSESMISNRGAVTQLLKDVFKITL